MNNVCIKLSGRRWLRAGLCRRARKRKVHFRHLARPLRGDEICLVRLEAGSSGENVVRELLDVCAVVLQGVVIAFPLHRNPVFGPGKFILQPQEILIRLQLPIVLDDGQ